MSQHCPVEWSTEWIVLPVSITSRRPTHPCSIGWSQSTKSFTGYVTAGWLQQSPAMPHRLAFISIWRFSAVK